MITEALVLKARSYVRRWFAERMPAHMVFHDLDHTLSVARTAVAIGRAAGLSAREVRLVELAALFHDTGYALQRKGHEKEGARIAADFLLKHGIGPTEVLRVKAMILATRSGAEPRGVLQQVLRDADQAKAGQPDFVEKSERLRDELAHASSKSLGARAWLNANIEYLREHRFHTAYANKRFGPQKTINLRELRQRASGQVPLAKVERVAERFVDRDISWLSFNERVLQEALDPRVPLLERVKFLGIFSSNLDEFYRVRVAGLLSLSELNKKQRSALEAPPAKRVARINRKALAQQRRFGALWRRVLVPALARNGICLLKEEQLSSSQLAFAERWFLAEVAPRLRTATIRGVNAAFIEDRKLYFICKVRRKGKTSSVLVNIPSDEVGRFLRLPSSGRRTDIVFLDDVVRANLHHVFPGCKVISCHAIKLSRDADLHLEEEYASNVVDKVRRSLRKRGTGVPARFLYDSDMPSGQLRELTALLGLKRGDLVAGGRYHHFNDLLKLPVEGYDRLRDTKLTTLVHPAWRKHSDVFRSAAVQDILLHFPYHGFASIVAWLRKAASDPRVERIAITLYRVAQGSEVCNALLAALANGKQVTVFVEVQARFDEGSNLYWGDVLRKAGGHVLYSYENLKVHCKLLLIERREGRQLKRYAYLGTGNFNERTAQVYSDTALITTNKGLTDDVAAVFSHLADRKQPTATRHLLLAPYSLRPSLEALIEVEAAKARLGKPSGIILKLNSLEDRALISKLYHASRAGVPVRIIVRGICCLVPGIAGLSHNIEVISIVDRFLEHSRAYVFLNGGDPLVYLASADFMERNMDRRIEVAFPLLDPWLKKELLHWLELQWQDNVKARVITEVQENNYRKRKRGEPMVQAQPATAAWLKSLARRKRAKGR